MKNRVRELREKAGLTQASLAKLTGVSRQAIHAIETGRYDPSIWLAYALSKAFGIPIEGVFIFGEREEND